MLSFTSVAEAYRPDPPSPAGVNFFLTWDIIARDLEEIEENVTLSFFQKYSVDALKKYFMQAKSVHKGDHSAKKSWFH